MSSCRFDNQVFVVTNAGDGLGKRCAMLLASQGARIVVNDDRKTVKKDGDGGIPFADLVVQTLRQAGHLTTPSYEPLEHASAIVRAAINTFGRIDGLVNIVEDGEERVSLGNMTDEAWEEAMHSHLHGGMKLARAVWPHFRKQRHGRIIFSVPMESLRGECGQVHYSAANMALIGFVKTLAKEGVKYNIHSNAVALPSKDQTEIGSPLIGVLAHQSCDENGNLFGTSPGRYTKIRWERSKGLLLKPDSSLTANTILENHNKIIDWTNPDYPSKTADIMSLLEKALAMPSGRRSIPLSFKGRVVLVTGAGAGLGRAYALAFGRLGATVIVNDLKGAVQVANELRGLGTISVALEMSVQNGKAIVQRIIQQLGRIDVVINNAGILRDKSFQNMTDSHWYSCVNVHLLGTFQVTRAAWPHFLKQGYGRVINITSTSGIYGNFGQANYAAAKSGIIGFTKAIAREGLQHNIVANAIAPSAGTNMTRTVRPESEIQALKPDYVAPLLLALCSERPPSSGQLYESASGWFAATRWQQSCGARFYADEGFPGIEDISKAWEQICDFGREGTDDPEKSWLGHMIGGVKQEGSAPVNTNGWTRSKI